MQNTVTRLGYLHTLALCVACIVACSTMGCFLQPPPSNPDTIKTPEPTAEQPIDPEPDEPAEPVIDEPLRQLEEPMDDLTEDEVEEQPTEPSADFNGDGTIDEDDIEIFRAQFGAVADDDSELVADLDGDGMVTLLDFQILISLITPEDAE